MFKAIVVTTLVALVTAVPVKSSVSKPKLFLAATKSNLTSNSSHVAQVQSVVVKAKLHHGASDSADFGDDKCPCIGIDNLEGETTVDIDGEKIEYPADLGARCEAWDNGVHPSSCREGQTPGLDQGWCADAWCYVDPRNCDLPVVPKPSVYVPNTTFQGLPVYFSYLTCGNKDSYTTKVPKVGDPDCRCIGFDEAPGATLVKIDGEDVSFPASIGGSCEAWDKDSHPDCSEDGKNEVPDWCDKRWCLVDPCACSIAVSPKTSSYFPNSTFQGRPVYYSYATCGATDTWTAENHEFACVNQKTKSACTKGKFAKKCAWTGSECLGKELAGVCEEEKEKKVQKAEKHSKHERSSAQYVAPGLVALLFLVFAA